jgi:hypothetical protein
MPGLPGLQRVYGLAIRGGKYSTLTSSSDHSPSPMAVLEGVKTSLGGEWARSMDHVVEWASRTGAGMW